MGERTYAGMRAAQELQEVLEDWILLGVSLNHDFPVVDGIELKYSEVAS